MKHKGNILIVAGEPARLRFLKDALKKTGCRLLYADNCEKALDSVHEKSPILILFDCQKHQKAEFEKIEKFRAGKKNRDIPILFLVKAVDLDNRVKYLKLSAADIILKPFKPEELLARVRTITGLQHLRIQLENRTEKLRQTNKHLKKEINERKQAELILNENEEVFNSFMENSPIYVYFKDENIRAVRLSRNFEKMLGRPLQEILGKNMEELFPSKLAKSMVADDIRILKEGKEIVADEEFDGRFYTTIKFPIHIEGKPRFLAGYTIDITDRKLAEEKSRRLAAIVESSNDAIMGKTLDGIITNCNKSTERIFGYTEEELVGKPISMLAPAGYGNEIPRLLEKIKNGELVDHYETVRLRKDGISIPVLITISPVKDEKGRIVSASVITRDITERKETQAALAAERSRLSYILEGTNVGTWEWNVQTGETIFNERWAEIIGYTLKELAPVSIDTWIKFAHPEDIKKSGDLLNKHFNKELKNYEFESRMRHKNGNWIWVLDRGKVATWTGDGKPLIMSGTHQDITERKQAEEAFRANSEMVQLLLNSSAEAIYGLDIKGLCTFNNVACLKILGYERNDELLGKNMHYLLHSKHADGNSYDVHQCPIFRAFKMGEKAHIDNEVFWKKDGTSFSVEYWSYPVYRNDEIIGAVVTFLDITERKQAEQALQKSTEEREILIKELQHALENVKTLQGLIPICANCKKIRDDKGYWNQVEEYIGVHTDAKFSHGLCPDCGKKLYGDLYESAIKKSEARKNI